MPTILIPIIGIAIGVLGGNEHEKHPYIGAFVRSAAGTVGAAIGFMVLSLIF